MLSQLHFVNCFVQSYVIGQASSDIVIRAEKSLFTRFTSSHVEKSIEQAECNQFELLQLNNKITKFDPADRVEEEKNVICAIQINNNFAGPF